MSHTPYTLRNFYKIIQKSGLFPSSSSNYLNNTTYQQKSYPIINITKRHAHAAPKTCWNCGHEQLCTTDFFCQKCSFIQMPHEKSNCFKVFELPEKFNIDQKDLTTKFRQMQNYLHPDKFSNRTDEEKRISEEYSALVNKAYSTLQAPLKRAIHLLNLNNDAIDENTQPTDQVFLMEIMELNEEIEEADTPDKIKALEKKNKQVLYNLAQEIANNFDKQNISEAKNSIIKMKYYTSVSNRIHNLLREKGIID